MLFGILAIAFLLRAAWAVIHRGVTPASDAAFYHQSAQLLLQGAGFVSPVTLQPTAFYSPGYSYFLTFCYSLFGPHVSVARALNVLLSTGMVYLTYRLAGRFFARRVAILAAALMAFFPGQVYWSASVMSEPLFGCLALLGLNLAFSRRRLAPLLCGLVFGASLLVRSQGVLLVPVMMLGFLEIKHLKRSALRAALFVAMVSIVLAPWLYRSYTLFGHPVLSTNSGGMLMESLYPAGANWSRPDFQLVVEHVKPPEGLNEYDRDQVFRRAAQDVLRQDPMRPVRQAPSKLFIFMRSDLASLESSQVVSADRLWDLFSWALGRAPRPAVSAGIIASIAIAQAYYAIVLLLGFVGLGACLRRQLRAFWAFAGIIGAFFAFHAVNAPSERYHFFLIPILSILAAVSLHEWGPRARKNAPDAADHPLSPVEV